MGKNRCKSTKMSKTWEKSGEPDACLKGNGTQPKKGGKNYGDLGAIHSQRYETHIIGPR